VQVMLFNFTWCVLSFQVPSRETDKNYHIKGLHVKGFYLLLYFIAVRTLLYSSLDLIYYFTLLHLAQ